MIRPFETVLLVLTLSFGSVACDDGAGDKALESSGVAEATRHVAPSTETARINADFGQKVDLANSNDFDIARRGFIATDSPMEIRRADGTVVWSQDDFRFLEGDAPASVNPSLWRQEKLNSIHGLFKVKEGLYQVRGYDLGNMTIIAGETGWILVDPLTVTETAAAALALVNRELGEKPIKAVIFTHSHIDHFGGVLGVISLDDVTSGRVRVIAPEGFLEEAISENVIAGAVMGRRAQYMVGAALEASSTAHVGTGLGKGAPVGGTFTIAPPTDIIRKTGQELTIDGVRMIFQNTPHSEAPAELMFYLPDLAALCGAEVISRNMHNLYTLRGAKVRDALRWSGYIDEAIDLFGDQTEVVFNSHHWPVFGNQASVGYLKRQRDTYKFIHDQSVRLASRGLTPREIAETIEMPRSLAEDFATRGYYGTVRHNSKAVYQFYFGWYDGNPANLDPLPPEAEGKRYVDAIGGAEAVLAQAEEAYASGDYRWTATLLNNLVFAEPDNEPARFLLAETYDQLGYRAESGPWRDNYLTGASELRHGPKATQLDVSSNAILSNIPLDKFFTSIAVRIDAEKAEGKNLTLNFHFRDVGETYVVNIENSVMHHWKKSAVPDADATVTLTRGFWLKILGRKASIRELVFSDELDIEGSDLKVLSFFMMLDRGVPGFPIVTP